MTAKKFSLVELLITLSIILVLSAMLMPMLNRARETAKSTSCKGNMKQSLTALFIYLDTYEVVSTQRWTDTLIATGLVSYPQISALRCPSWIRERDTHKNVFGMRRIIGDAHTLHITGSPSHSRDHKTQPGASQHSHKPGKNRGNAHNRSRLFLEPVAKKDRSRKRTQKGRREALKDPGGIPLPQL